MEPERTAGRDPDWTDAASDGVPPLEDQPPGIDAETAHEGMLPPRDHPVAAEEVGVTAAEESVPETLRERVARERPDAPQRPPEDGVGSLGETDEERSGELIAELEPDPRGASAEEQAVHVDRRGA